MRILILSLFYRPDLSACSFRTTALVQALLDQLPGDAEIDVVTTLPHRYGSFTDYAVDVDEDPRVRVRRIALPDHRGGMASQVRAFGYYVVGALRLASGREYDLVYGTSSRLMTAALASFLGHRKDAPVYLDIRDIFVDTIKDVLSPGLARVLKPVFAVVEGLTVRAADHVNLVSRGFETYFFARYPQQEYSYFTNGVDDEFTQVDWGGRANVLEEGPIRVVYAGNIGEGQGLHAIIPALARRLEGKVDFKIIGDGARRQQLKEGLEREGCQNVRLVQPMRREQLIHEYRSADVLFMHLNDYPAFGKVLPSKVFEYAATGKPVWAGVAGYAARFVSGEIENAAVFPPCDVDGALLAIDRLSLGHVDRADFCNSYARSTIMGQMAADLVRFVQPAGPPRVGSD